MPKPIYVLIIDEINRGHVTQIFGEIMTIMENCGKHNKVDLRYKLDPPFDGAFMFLRISSSLAL